MNKLLITGVMLSLSVINGFAADRVPENGFGIVPMPYEATTKAGKPFVITKDTVIVGQAAATKNCAAYLQERLRKSSGLTLKRKGECARKGDRFEGLR